MYVLYYLCLYLDLSELLTWVFYWLDHDFKADAEAIIYNKPIAFHTIHTWVYL